MKIINLASGSKGNCTYIESENTHILVDVGVCFDELKQNLALINVDILKIDAILITHEHSDHIKGLGAFIKHNPTVQIYAHPRTMIRLSEKTFIPLGNQNAILQADFYVKDLTISAFSLSHDASHCLGYCFFENGKKFSIATDVGYVSDALINNLIGSDLVFLECNYDQTMLYYCDKYPQKIKDRINSKLGHLSNNDCADLVAKLIISGTTRFALAHISENTNTYDLALKTVCDCLTLKGLLNNNINIETLNQWQMSHIFEI